MVEEGEEEEEGGGKSEDSFSGEYVLMCGLMW